MVIMILDAVTSDPITELDQDFVHWVCKDCHPMEPPYLAICGYVGRAGEELTTDDDKGQPCPLCLAVDAEAIAMGLSDWCEIAWCCTRA